MTSLRNHLAHVVRRARGPLHALRPVARWNDGCRRLATCQGQGTVEYVGIVLVVGALLIALKAGMKGHLEKAAADKISDAVTAAIGTVIAAK